MDRFDALFAENPEARVLVDRFVIPLTARAEFEAAMNRNTTFLSRGSPGSSDTWSWSASGMRPTGS